MMFRLTQIYIVQPVGRRLKKMGNPILKAFIKDLSTVKLLEHGIKLYTMMYRSCKNPTHVPKIDIEQHECYGDFLDVLQEVADRIGKG
jgi:hypothetical protein